MMSMKLLVISRLARRINSGAGLVGSWRSIQSQTRSSAFSASSRLAIAPGVLLAPPARALGVAPFAAPWSSLAAVAASPRAARAAFAVSYTHLTLPTIYSV